MGAISARRAPRSASAGTRQDVRVFEVRGSRCSLGAHRRARGGRRRATRRGSLRPGPATAHRRHGHQLVAPLAAIDRAHETRGRGVRGQARRGGFVLLAPPRRVLVLGGAGGGHSHGQVRDQLHEARAHAAPVQRRGGVRVRRRSHAGQGGRGGGPQARARRGEAKGSRAQARRERGRRERDVPARGGRLAGDGARGHRGAQEGRVFHRRRAVRSGRADGVPRAPRVCGWRRDGGFRSGAAPVRERLLQDGQRRDGAGDSLRGRGGEPGPFFRGVHAGYVPGDVRHVGVRLPAVAARRRDQKGARADAPIQKARRRVALAAVRGHARPEKVRAGIQGRTQRVQAPVGVLPRARGHGAPLQRAAALER